jgi:hypothetical protein
MSWACFRASAGVTPPTPLGALAFSVVISSPMAWRKRDPNECGTPSFGRNTRGFRGIDKRAHKLMKRRTATAAKPKEMMIHTTISIYPALSTPVLGGWPPLIVFQTSNCSAGPSLSFFGGWPIAAGLVFCEGAGGWQTLNAWAGGEEARRGIRAVGFDFSLGAASLRF